MIDTMNSKTIGRALWQNYNSITFERISKEANIAPYQVGSLATDDHQLTYWHKNYEQQLLVIKDQAGLH